MIQNLRFRYIYHIYIIYMIIYLIEMKSNSLSIYIDYKKYIYKK